jgi:hypothetical protein
MSKQSTITSLQRLSSIWARLIASSTYVIWTKARLWFMISKWYIEDGCEDMKRRPTSGDDSQNKAHKSNNSQRIDTSDLGTPIIQREKGFI